MKKKIILACLVLALAGGGFAYWKTRSVEGVKILETAPVTRATVRKVLEATGIIKPEVGAIVKIGSQATGRIKRMHVKVGDQVQAGQLIAEIDDREVQSKKTELTASLDKTLAQLELVERVYPLKIQEAEAEARAAKAESAYATLSLDRKKSLVRQKLESQNTEDDAQKSFDATRHQTLSKEAALVRVRTEFELELHKARRAVAEIRAQLESNEVKLSYTKIFSPLTGVVSKVTSQEGETVVAGLQVADLITVLDPTRLEMWIYVDETDVGQIRPGMTVEFRVDSFPGRVFPGMVDQIYPGPEIRDNIVYYQTLVRLTPETARELRPEMTTQCRVVVETKDNVLAVPNAAVKWVDGERVVFVPRALGRPERVKPKLGLAGLEASEVLEGLAEGDTVAVKLVLPKSERKPGAK